MNGHAPNVALIYDDDWCSYWSTIRLIVGEEIRLHKFLAPISTFLSSKGQSVDSVIAMGNDEDRLALIDEFGLFGTKWLRWNKNNPNGALVGCVEKSDTPESVQSRINAYAKRHFCITGDVLVRVTIIRETSDLPEDGMR